MWTQKTNRTQVFINYIYIYIYIYIYATQSAQLSQKKVEYKTHIKSLPGYHQSGFVATQTLGHLIYVMYSKLLHCI